MPVALTPSKSTQDTTSTVAHDVRLKNSNLVDGRLVVAARGLLGWQQIELAERCGIRRQTLADFEVGKRSPRSNIRTAVLSVLQDAGIRFIELADGVGLVRVGDDIAADDAEGAFSYAHSPGAVTTQG